MNEQLQNELEEQARLLGMSAERECDLRGKLERERALADRLAGAIQSHLELDQNIDATLDELNNAWECLQSSITAWKEARSE